MGSPTALVGFQASPNAAIIQLFLSQGLHFDASSTFEVSLPALDPHPQIFAFGESYTVPRDLRIGMHTWYRRPWPQVRRAMAAGVPPQRISLSTQELSPDFSELVELGVKVNACSLAQP